MKDAFAKLNSEAIHVQLSEDCPEDVVMGLDYVHEDRDGPGVDGNPLDSSQSLIDATLEAGARNCQSMGHVYVLV